MVNLIGILGRSKVSRVSNFRSVNRVTFRSKSGIAESIRLPLFSTAFDPKLKEKVAFTDYNGINYTYQDLGQRSLTLAKELRSRVTGEEERVAFLCDRNFSFPTALVATWISKHVGSYQIIISLTLSLFSRINK